MIFIAGPDGKSPKNSRISYDLYCKFFPVNLESVIEGCSDSAFIRPAAFQILDAYFGGIFQGLQEHWKKPFSVLFFFVAFRDVFQKVVNMLPFYDGLVLTPLTKRPYKIKERKFGEVVIFECELEA